MIVDDEYLDKFWMNDEKGPYQATNKIMKKPKLKFNRLPDEKKIVSISLDVQINEKLIIRDHFDWKLDDTNISPSLFSEKFCQELNLPDQNKDNIKNQILMQIIEHIERNTLYPKSKLIKQYESNEASALMNQQDFKYDANLSIGGGMGGAGGIGGIVGTGGAGGQINKDDEPESQMKQTERQKILEEMKKKTSIQSKVLISFDTKKECKYCKLQQLATLEICRKCKIPFRFTEKIDVMTEREILSLKYLDQLIKQIDLVAEADIDKLLDFEDLQSVYYLKNIIIHKLAQTEEVKTLDTLEELINAVNTIYDECILADRFDVSDKTREYRDKAKDDSSDDDDTSTSRKEDRSKIIRKRGRPKKLILPKRYMLKKNKPQ